MISKGNVFDADHPPTILIGESRAWQPLRPPVGRSAVCSTLHDDGGGSHGRHIPLPEEERRVRV